MRRPKAKIAITISPDVLDRVRAQVDAGPVKSVSAYVEYAIRQQLNAEAEWELLVEEVFAATGGPPTDEELAAADALLTGTTVHAESAA